VTVTAMPAVTVAILVSVFAAVVATVAAG